MGPPRSYRKGSFLRVRKPPANSSPILLLRNPLVQPDFDERSPIHAYALPDTVYIAHEGLPERPG